MDRISLRRFATIALDSPRASARSSASSNSSLGSSSRSSGDSRESLLRQPLQAASDNLVNGANRELSLSDANPIVVLTLRILRGGLQGFTSMEPFVAQLKTLKKVEGLGLIDAEDRQLLAEHLPRVAAEERHDIRQLPGLQPADQQAVNALINGSSMGSSDTIIGIPLAPTATPMERPSAAPRVPTNVGGGKLLSPQELAHSIGLPLARKSSGTTDEGFPLAKSRQKLPSYLTSDSQPGKAWRVSPSFRRGGYKKIRLALDNEDKLGIFTVQYIKEATRYAPRSQQPTSIYQLTQSEQMLQEVGSPLGIAEGTENVFVDQKGRVWNWRPFFSTDVADLSAGLRKVAPDSKGAFLRLMLGMAEDVARIHDKKLMLLDIKPANFLYDEKHGVAFGDFDFTRPTGTMDYHTWCGTTGYMAPEMVDMMGRQIGRRADIFSLGQTFVKVATGSILTAFDTERPKDFTRAFHQIAKFDLDARVESVIDPGTKLGTLQNVYGRLFSLNEWLADFVLDRMLNADPDLRPTAKEVVSKLREIVPDDRVASENEIAGIAQAVATELANISTEDLLSDLEARPVLPPSNEA